MIFKDIRVRKALSVVGFSKIVPKSSEISGFEATQAHGVFCLENVLRTRLLFHEKSLFSKGLRALSQIFLEPMRRFLVLHFCDVVVDPLD